MRRWRCCASGSTWWLARETLPLADALGRVLAADVMAKRANPPQPNTAVDGYGFAGAIAAGAHVMPLVSGRAAAGACL